MNPVRQAAGVWGDGFASDDFEAMRAVSDWAVCSTDEYAILFPRLVPPDGRLPAALDFHLAAGVAALTARVAQLDLASASGRVAPRRTGAAPGLRRLARMLGGIGFRRPASPRERQPERADADRRLLALLDGVLADVRRGASPAWSEDREAWFAFGSGIHPGYLWPESAASPSRGLTAAWLGHLDRGRAALMPEPVADYLLDAVLNEAGARDGALASMVGLLGAPVDARRLRRAAAARLAGEEPVVRPGPGRDGAASRRRAAPAQPAAVPVGAFEHA